MKKGIFLITFIIAMGVICTFKTNSYQVMDIVDGKLLVNRKGCAVILYDPSTNYQVGDSIKFYGDFDFLWNSMSICE